LLSLLLLVAAAYRVVRVAHRRPPPQTRSGTDHVGHQRGLQAAVLAAISGAIRLLIRLGVRVGPMMMLTVRGRKSQLPRSNPVDLFEQNGRYWLVATHSADAAWVRNLRAAGQGGLALGRRRMNFNAVELPAEQAGAVLQAVIGPRLSRLLAGVVLRQTMGVAASAGLDEFVAAADRHPVFELTITETMKVPGSVPAALIGVGLLIGVLHASLGAANVVTAGMWISGAVLGLLIAGIGNHQRIYRRI
jgi:deazaflavin-dependent oxidoreductase (nitroreductase family)